MAQGKSAGLLGWEWIYVFALLRSMNGSESPRVRKLPRLNAVVAGLFWRISGGGL